MAPFGIQANADRTVRSAAFTLLELLVVITIIGLLAALAMPVMRNFKANYTASVSSQLLTDLARARQLAISERTTVYMVFVPTNFWKDAGYNSGWSAASPGRSSNLFEKQLVAYNFATLHSLGDQPGRNTVKYLSSWKTLPEGAFIHPAKFQANIKYPTPVMLILTNGVSGFPVYSMSYSDYRTPNVPNPVVIPFPSEDTPETRYVTPYVRVPYIAFDYMGRLTTGRDEIIPLTKGNVLFSRDANGLGKPVLPSFMEQPPGNTTNTFNLVYIDWLTGRARTIQQEVQ